MTLQNSIVDTYKLATKEFVQLKQNIVDIEQLLRYMYIKYTLYRVKVTNEKKYLHEKKN